MFEYFFFIPAKLYFLSHYRYKKISLISRGILCNVHESLSSSKLQDPSSGSLEMFVTDAHGEIYFWFLSNCKEYDRSYRFPFDYMDHVEFC